MTTEAAEEKEAYHRFIAAYREFVGPIEPTRLPFRTVADVCDDVLNVVEKIFGTYLNPYDSDVPSWHLEVRDYLLQKPRESYIQQLWHTLPILPRELFFLESSFNDAMQIRRAPGGARDTSRLVSATQIGRQRLQTLSNDPLLHVFEHLPAVTIFDVLNTANYNEALYKEAFLLILKRDIVMPMEEEPASTVDYPFALRSLPELWQHSRMATLSYNNVLEDYLRITEKIAERLYNAVALALFGVGTNPVNILSSCTSLRLEGNFFSMTFRQQPTTTNQGAYRVKWICTTAGPQGRRPMRIIPGKLGVYMREFASDQGQEEMQAFAVLDSETDAEAFKNIIHYVVAHIDPTVGWVASLSPHHVRKYFYFPARTTTGLATSKRLLADAYVVGPKTRYRVVAERIGPLDESEEMAVLLRRAPTPLKERIVE